MSLQTRLTDLVLAIGTQFKTLRTMITGSAIGTLADLNTTNKSSLIAAINEVKGQAQSAGSSAIIDDAVASQTKVWSSQKTSDHVATSLAALTAGAPGALNTLDELAAAMGDDANFAATMTAALANRVRVDTATQALTALQQSNARANIGAVATAAIGDPETDLVAAFAGALV
ncbi:MAG: hypothetical protein MUF14_05680 [Hyphomonadaceae bacterium]|jgi:hypothetical protein|nr:hypothetical protein [Hyphomonadaceae bacterium]